MTEGHKDSEKVIITFSVVAKAIAAVFLTVLAAAIISVAQAAGDVKQEVVRMTIRIEAIREAQMIIQQQNERRLNSLETLINRLNR